jgi:serine/threonine protein kinase
LALGLDVPIPNADAVERGPATRFAGYEMIEEVARGAMGVVFRAREAQSRREVALKVVSAGRFASPADLARFRQEAEVAGSLLHPNIVPIFHVGDEDGRPFFTMPLLEGGNLSTRIADFVGNPERAASLLTKVARAVHHAHQHGVLHRDLKPSNILLDHEGEPHVTDFGLAKYVEGSAELTLSGAALGTPGYMAPEQASGLSKEVTIAADVYSLGAIFYELLTGRPVFQAESALALMRKTVEEQPELPSMALAQRLRAGDGPASEGKGFRSGLARAGISADVDVICLKCLAKAPADRYPSAGALAEDLERWLRHEPISARPPTRWERVTNHVRLHPIRAALTGLALLALLLTATYTYASYRTFFWLMAKIEDEHLIQPPAPDGVYSLYLHPFRDFRWTYNFWKLPLWHKLRGRQRYARIEFTNIPPALASQIKVQVFADIPALPDPAKTPPLTNGQIFFIPTSALQERAFYFGSTDLPSSNVLAQATNAAIRVILLGHPGDPDPYQPAGRLTEEERQ